MSIFDRPRASLFANVSVLFSLLFCSSSYAQYYQNLTIGNAKALALGNAVTADPPGVDSIHFNPAGLYRALESRQMNLTEINLAGALKRELTYTANFTGELPDFNYIGCDVECLLANNGEDSITYEVDKFYSWVPWAGKTDPAPVAPRGGAAFLAEGGSVAFGTSTYFLFQSGAELDKDAPGSYPRKALTGGDAVLLSPSISVKVNDTLYLGASIPLHYAGMELTSSMRLVNPIISLLNQIVNETCDVDEPLEYCAEGGNQIDVYDEIFEADISVEDTFTPSFNVGFLWEPAPWVSIGGVYQSKVEQELEGTYTIRYVEGLGRLINTGIVDFLPNSPDGGVTPGDYSESGKVKIDQVLPAHYSLGVSLRIFPDLKLNVDYKKTFFSEWKEMLLEFEKPTYVTAIVGLIGDDPVNSFASPRGFIDGDNLAYGLEYQWSDRLALRMGYEKRDSVVPDNMRSPAFSLGGDLTLKSVGFSYEYSNTMVIDMAYAQIRSSQNIPSGSSYITTWDATELYALYPGYDISNEVNLDVLLLGVQYFWE